MAFEQIVNISKSMPYLFRPFALVPSSDKKFTEFSHPCLRDALAILDGFGYNRKYNIAKNEE